MKLLTLLIFLCLPHITFALSADEASESNNNNNNDTLATALVSSNWSWEETTTGTKRYEEIQFYQGGLAGNSSFRWTAHWEIAGPHILVLENTTPHARYLGKKSYLVFDATFTHFTGFDFNGRTLVEGFRREAVDPKRQPPAAKEN